MPIGFDALTSFSDLAYLKRGVHAKGMSSADPTQQNDDQAHYLYSDGDEKVLFDEIGPGVIYRFWHTGDNSGTYKFYFDGEATASLVLNGAQLCDAKIPPFVEPLLLTRPESSGGIVSYYPIAFAKSLKVTSTGPRTPDFYNFSYAIYPGTSIESFTGAEDGSGAIALLKAAGDNPNPPDPSDTTEKGTVDISAGAATTLASLTGPGEMTELRGQHSWSDQHEAGDHHRRRSRDDRYFDLHHGHRSGGDFGAPRTSLRFRDRESDRDRHRRRHAGRYVVDARQ